MHRLSIILLVIVSIKPPHVYSHHALKGATPMEHCTLVVLPFNKIVYYRHTYKLYISVD